MVQRQQAGRPRDTFAGVARPTMASLGPVGGHDNRFLSSLTRPSASAQSRPSTCCPTCSRRGAVRGLYAIVAAPTATSTGRHRGLRAMVCDGLTAASHVTNTAASSAGVHSRLTWSRSGSPRGGAYSGAWPASRSTAPSGRLGWLATFFYPPAPPSARALQYTHRTADKRYFEACRAVAAPCSRIVWMVNDLPREGLPTWCCCSPCADRGGSW